MLLTLIDIVVAGVLAVFFWTHNQAVTAGVFGAIALLAAAYLIWSTLVGEPE